MKPTNSVKLPKTARCAYLYSDGHAVIVHCEKHPKAGEVEWVEIYERLDVSCGFDGRLVLHHPTYDKRVEMILNAYRVEAKEPSVSVGSDNTKRHDIRVGSIAIEFKDGKSLYWVTMPDLISDGITYQPQCVEPLNVDDCAVWCGKRVAKLHRAEREPEADQVAA